MFRLVRSLALLVVAGSFASFAVAEDTWTEMRSPHFRIVTNGAPADARKVAEELEQFRFVLRWRFPGFRIDFDAPFTVYAARDFGTALKLAPFWKPTDNAYVRDGDGDYIDLGQKTFFGNWERNVALVELDTWNKTSHDRLYAGYTHEMLVQNMQRFPKWLDRGLSELLAYTRFSGKDLVLGSPAPGWPELKTEKLLPLADLVHDEPILSPSRADRYAGWGKADYMDWKLKADESWALVHFLTFAQGMGSGAKLLELMHQLQAGQKSEAAFQAVFGDPARLDEAFSAYIHAKALNAAVAPDYPALDPSSIVERPLSKAQALTEEAIFNVETGNRERSRSLLEQALQLDPSLAVAHEELGILLFGTGDISAPREHWHTAMTLDPARYVSAFATVMTGPLYHEQTPEQLDATLAELRRIVHLNPQFAPAYTQVAIVLWWQGKLDVALRAASEAQRLAPQRPGYKILKARLLLAQHQGKDAAAIARRAAENEDDLDGAMAVALWQQIPSEQHDPGPMLAYHLPPGVVYGTGKLVKMDCGDYRSRAPIHAEVRTDGAAGGQMLDLMANDRAHIGFADTVWIGGGHDFVCKAATGRPVEFLYKPGSKGYGELFGFNTSDDLPRASTGASGTETTSNAP